MQYPEYDPDEHGTNDHLKQGGQRQAKMGHQTGTIHRRLAIRGTLLVGCVYESTVSQSGSKLVVVG